MTPVLSKRTNQPPKINHLTTHGMRWTRIYNIYTHMKNRAGNPRKKYYKDIRCDWDTFEEFYRDMGTAYHDHVRLYGEKDTTLERINNQLGYNKSNCRWATYAEQNRNTRHNRMIEFKGRTQCLSDWAEELGIKRTTLIMRIDSYGWSINKAFTKGTA